MDKKQSTMNVLRSFNPNNIYHSSQDEVYFVEGRYIDIANTKNKDPHTLYFGKSSSSKLLSGLFLGDTELTSKVKDVSLLPVNGDIVLSVKYINDAGKLASVKTILSSLSTVKDINDLVNDLLKVTTAKFNNIDKQIKVLDSSIVNINDHLSVIDSSIDYLLRMKCSITKEEPSVDNKFTPVYSILNDNLENYNSAKIEVPTLTVKQLSYDEITNSLKVTVLPDVVKSVDTDNHIITLEDNTTVNSTEDIENLILRVVTADLGGYDLHIKDVINTDSSVNDRLIEVENSVILENAYDV